MKEQEAIALANLLSVSIQLGIQAYTQIQKAHADALAPVEEIIAKADANFDSVIATAKAEIEKLSK